MTELAPGVFVFDGAYQAVAVAFNDYAIVIDGMQNEARTRAVIEQTKKAIPGKPIRYVVVSTLTSITSPASGISSVKARPSSRMK